MDEKTKKNIIKDLDQFYGRNGFNPSQGDIYFKQSLIQKYGMSIEEMRKKVDYN